METSWHRTKIVCTLGPATDSPDILSQLMANGMDIARLNLSHGDHNEQARRAQQVREVASHMKQPVGLLMDLPGPKFRIGTLPGGSRNLEKGDHVSLADESGEPDFLPVRHRELLRALRAEESVYLADGSIELRVLSTAADRVDSEVVIGGTVRSGSGINVPDSQLGELIPTDDDRRHLAFAVSQEADWIGVSFVQTADDLERVRACLPAVRRPLLMAKIEKRQALANLEAIVEASDGVMVARGDLGVETDLAAIPLVQKRIIAVANAKARPVVTATQMLESMVEQPHPTRAEVTDVANAVLDGTDGVMLSAESAVGRYPVAAVKILQRVVAATEMEYGARMARAHLRQNAEGMADDALGVVACQLAARLKAKAILAEFPNVAAAAAVARFRPDVPIIVVTDSVTLYRSLAPVWGVSPVFAGNGVGRSYLAQASDWLFLHKLARPGDQIVVLSASPPGGQGGADTLQVVRLAA